MGSSRIEEPLAPFRKVHWWTLGRNDRFSQGHMHGWRQAYEAHLHRHSQQYTEKIGEDSN